MTVDVHVDVSLLRSHNWMVGGFRGLQVYLIAQIASYLHNSEVATVLFPTARNCMKRIGDKGRAW